MASTAISLSVFDEHSNEVAIQALRSDRPHRINMGPHTPRPTNRFASPSCPWPWAGDDESDEQRMGDETPPGSRQQSPVRGGASFSERDWRMYPGQFFPNWTPWVVSRCGMGEMFGQQAQPECQVYVVDVLADSRFRPVTTRTVPITTRFLEPEPMTADLEAFMKSDRENVRLRCICVENLSGDALQILGTFYHIEPFYFSSAINRIPSRYYEDFDQGTRDHTYITLPFLRVKKRATIKVPTQVSERKRIDVLDPLEFTSGDGETEHILQQDMLAVLLVRDPSQQTLITIHPAGIEGSAKKLSKRILMAGKGIYWGNLMRGTGEPLFVLLIVMWSVLYAWDEAMELLYSHVLHLEAQVLDLSSADLGLTRALHNIRAHLLHYDELLEEFKRSLDFLQIVTVKDEAKKLVEKELKILENEVDRLHRRMKMQDERLNNVMKLVLSVLNIQETRTSLQHSESMRQITYLTMIYLPASFMPVYTRFAESQHEYSVI